ncbi:MAG TPA: HDOD domain-containing protein [Rhodocyclaceae bacterium]|nr:HDOD domain-containing protein [Rhodocyclaceae bacterium]
MPGHVNRNQIIERAGRLPVFPRVVTDILATLDDDNATMGNLAHHVEQDPVVTARILSLANGAAHAHGGGLVRDMVTATSMVGIAKVRELVLSLSLARFAGDSRVSSYFWEHSVAVGVCAQELSRQVAVCPDHALVAGLLHDIGQLWMAKFYPLEVQQVRMAVSAGTVPIREAEKQYFGLDHCEIGYILADHWNLPESVAVAIYHHHGPAPGLGQPLADVTHVAEVLANALDLTRRDDNQVAYLSPASCAVLDLDWSEDQSQLFGRIEARAQYACAAFR